jgi:5-methylcytosine-specific restriction protein A
MFNMSVVNKVSMRPKNPDWVRDEVILALDLYFRIDAARASAETPEIIELSGFLRELGIHHEQATEPTFRNPTGVHMILCNFLALDARYSGIGLSRGSRLQKQIWSEFCESSEALHSAARQIRERLRRKELT